MNVQHKHQILILVKTYPAPSATHIEICCTAGIDADGKMVRIYPVPFRLMAENKQYTKWQWIEAETSRPPKDHRPESRRINCDDMRVDPRLIIKDWSEKMKWLDRCPHFDSIEGIEQARQKKGVTLGIVPVIQILDLEIRSEAKDWTKEQLEKLTQQLQTDFFSDQACAIEEARRLEKIPFGFYYKFMSRGCSNAQTIRITDWEICQLYRKMSKKYPNPDVWQAKMRQKYVEEFSTKDVYLILGNQHRFPDQWLCIGVVAAPKGTQAPATGELF